MRDTDGADETGVLPRLRAAWLGVFGIPNYDAYLAHMHATHPGETPLERRYARRGPRCC